MHALSNAFEQGFSDGFVLDDISKLVVEPTDPPKTDVPLPEDWHVGPSVLSTRLRGIRPWTSTVARLIGLHADFLVREYPGRSPLELSVTEIQALLDAIRPPGQPAPLSPTANMQLLRRISWRMQVHQISDTSAYKALLLRDPEELTALRKSFSVRVTDFFDNPARYIHIERLVASELLDEALPSGIQICVLGRETAEEAYSVAMLFDDMARSQKRDIRLVVVAEDWAGMAPLLPRQDGYPHLVHLDLSSYCLDTYFEATREGYRINNTLKSLVHFSKPPERGNGQASEHDLLICPEPFLLKSAGEQAQYVNLFSRKIRPGGFLVLNTTGMPGSLERLFAPVNADHGIFQRKDGPMEPGAAFDRVPKTDPLAAAAAPHAPHNRDAEIIHYLENELTRTKERLEATVNEYESTHNELVDLNHKLQSDMKNLLHERGLIDAECASLRNMMGNTVKANKDLKGQNNQLHKNQQWLDEIISHCGLGILCVDDAGCISMFSPPAAQLFNLDRSDIGRPLTHLESPLQMNLAEEAGRVMRNCTPVEEETSSTTGNWYRISLQPRISSGEVRGMVCTILDVTESKRENEWDRFRADILNQIQDAVIVTNPYRQVTYVNKAAIQRFGLFQKKKAGYPLDTLYRSVWKSSVEEKQARDVLKETGVWSGELYHQRADGRKVRVHVSMHVLEDDTGEKKGTMTVIRNGFNEKAPYHTESLRRIIEDLQQRNEALENTR